MNKTVGWIVVVIIVVLGIWYFMSGSDTAPVAPVAEEGAMVGSVDTTTPAPTEVVAEEGQLPVAVTEVTVTGENFKFTPAEIRVKTGDTVRLTFKNTTGTHDWKLDKFAAATRVLQAGQEETIEFVASEQGSFEYYCSVGTHRQMGMKGTLIVE